MAGSTMYLKKGATLPAAEAILSYSDGTVQDLTGAAVRFVMRLKATGAEVVNTAATVVDATTASVRYDWDAGDTDTVGIYECEWKVVLVNLKVGYFPSRGYNEVVIVDDVAA